MKRFVYSKLVEWKNKNNRKPLILQGARQVGKTWLLEELGKNEFDNVVEINFEENIMLQSLFEKDFDVDRIINTISIVSNQKIIPGKTLIIFDEIQEAKRALLSLKYFLKNAPQYHIAAAGSLLGLSIHEQDSFPVGKVEFIDIQPMTFIEFLEALGENSLVTILEKGQYDLLHIFKEKYIERLKQYYFVGGMPEVVDTFIKTKDYSKAREVQMNLINSYQKDFSKHPPLNIIPRIRLVWDSIPTQLSKENKKFIYGAVRPGSRAKDFELAIQWLQDAGSVYKVTRVTNASLPIKGFEDPDAFKLYYVDIGLLSAISSLSATSLIEGNSIFNQYKGALTEQFVFQQLNAIENIQIHYWSPETGIAELDFLIQNEDEIVAIEVKAEENLKSKSLKVYQEKYKPKFVIRSSMSDYRVQEKLINIPLYAINSLIHLLDGGIV